MDYGPDNYAGVTFSNTGSRRILLGWMSNWMYADQVPTSEWRSAMTVPRELSLVKINGNAILAETPVREVARLIDKDVIVPIDQQAKQTELAGSPKAKQTERARNSTANNTDYPTNTKAKQTEHSANSTTKQLDLSANLAESTGLYRISFDATAKHPVSVTLSNNKQQQVIIGFDPAKNEFYIDRSLSGNKDFNPGFFKRSTASRVSNAQTLHVDLLIDHASVELFADNGTTVMTAIFFPDEVFKKVTLEFSDQKSLSNVRIANVRPAW